jgi:uncharacterized protein (DUF362 family)
MHRRICAKRDITRRQFLSTLSTATAGFLVGGFGKENVYANIPFEDPSKVAVASLSSYDRTLIRNTLQLMTDNLGGLGDIIKSGDKVGIKINLTGGTGYAVSYQNQTGMPPGETFWTHPEILRSIGELVKDAGAAEIYVIEAIYDWESFNNFGYRDVADYLGASLVDLNQKAPYSDYAERSVGDNAFIYETLFQNGLFNDFDCLISLAKSKRHTDAGVTHGIKNLVGALPVPAGIYNDGQGHRAAIHQHTIHDGNPDSNLCRVMMDIHSATPLQLVVNDAIRTVLGGEGPWVNVTPASFDTLVASKDPVAADAIATQAIGFDPMAQDLTVPFPTSVNYLRLANALGMGNYDLTNIEVIDVTSTSISANQRDNIPVVMHLRNYPNPFNGETTFRFSLSRSGFTTVVIYNTMGQPVRKLLAKSLPLGTNKIRWDGRDNRGEMVSSGIYVTTVKSNRYSKSLKVALMK